MMVLLYAVALWAGLEALRSVLSFIVPYLGLAIIVLFQSEIRRTLARDRGANGGWPRVSTRRNRPTRFCWRWNNWHRRAPARLIVLERISACARSSRAGLPLEALLSRDLLLSIFQPGLPLHDGAVIVQKGRHRGGGRAFCP